MKTIRLAIQKDLPFIMEIIKEAKDLLKKSGSKQWNTADGYPSIATISADIENQHCYVALDKEIICGIATFLTAPEKSYQKIKGSWLSASSSYLTIHRLAVKKEYYGKGISSFIIAYAKTFAKQKKLLSIRVDTHKKNMAMQKTLEKNSFLYCGTIELVDCLEDNQRLAYELLI